MKTYCGCIFVLVAIATVSASSNSIEDDSTDLSYQCGAYCFIFLRPVLQNALDTKIKIDTCDSVTLAKEVQIQELKEQLAVLQVNISIYKELETLHHEKSKYKDDLITALEQKSCSERNQSLIESLKAQIESNTAAIQLLNGNIASLNQSVLLQEHNAKYKNSQRVEAQAMNCVPFVNSSAIHEINVDDFGKFSVRCDAETAGSGWTVVQRRFDGSVDFYRGWSEYRDGFGNLDGEFFMGLEKLHRMTKSVPYELYIELADFKDNVRHARYDNFLIGSEEERYMLKSIGTYSGSAGNALNYNLHDRFTTFDKDNDNWGGGNCADWYGSGWWYGLHGNSNLNGIYVDHEEQNQKSIWWYNWKGYGSLKSVRMMIRPKYTSV